MSTVFVFGAGATKACGGPLTNEILPEAFDAWDEFPDMEREGFLGLVDHYLVEKQHVPADIQARAPENYPELPDLLATLDATIDRGQGMGDNWAHETLVEVRRGLEYLIFALLQRSLSRLTHNYYRRLFDLCDDEPQAISVNYDIIADNAMVGWAERNGELAFPDYGTEVSTVTYSQFPKVGRLLKLHGSLNWYYCPGCNHLYVGVAESGKFYKVLEELYVEDPLEPRYSCQGSNCKDCGQNVAPILITPTHQRDYQNPRIADVWQQAEQMLAHSDRVVFVGYSLPREDNYVMSLFSTHLAHLSADRVTVVEKDPAAAPMDQNPVGQRYFRLFGDGIDWRPEGFGPWVTAQQEAGTRF